jgi:hypothetical protein
MTKALPFTQAAIKRVLSRTEAAAYLDMSLDTLDRLRAAGAIIACPVSARLVKYRVADLDCYLETCQTSALSKSPHPQTGISSGLKADTRAALQRARQIALKQNSSLRRTA